MRLVALAVVVFCAAMTGANLLGLDLTWAAVWTGLTIPWVAVHDVAPRRRFRDHVGRFRS